MAAATGSAAEDIVKERERERSGAGVRSVPLHFKVIAGEFMRVTMCAQRSNIDFHQQFDSDTLSSFMHFVVYLR